MIVFSCRNPALNKSFDILPQIKDDNAPSIDPVEDNSVSKFLFLEELIIKLNLSIGNECKCIGYNS